MSETKKIHILDLCEETPESLKSFLSKMDCEVVSRDGADNYEKLDFLFVDSEEEAKVAARDFSCDKNEIAIVCLGPVKETRGFLLGSGRLTIDPEFLESKLGEAILTKFFGGNYNIHLDESFSGLFPDVENFKITNHLALGTSLDELAMKAFERDFNIVALRSFLDHALIYFTYLKQAGLAGVPFEIEHSANDDFFAVNIHAPVKNFAAEYLLDSFGSVNSKDPIQYLLGVTSRSADFMDITHVENPGRLVLSGFWSRSAKRRLSGLAFNNIKTTAQMSAQLDKKIRVYKPAEELVESAELRARELKTKSLPGGILAMALSEGEDTIFSREPEKATNLIAFVIGHFEEVFPDQSINDMDEDDLKTILSQHPEGELAQTISDQDRDDLLDKIQKKNITDAYNEELSRAREGLKEDDGFKEELSDAFNEEVVSRVSGQLDAEALNRIMGSKDEAETVQRIGGKEDVDGFKAVVKGVKEKRKGEFAQKISGSFESKKGEFRMLVSGDGGDPKKGLFDFVNSTVKGIEDSDFDLDEKTKSFFRQTAPHKIARGLEKHASDLGLDISELEEGHLLDFKSRLLPDIVEEALSDEASMEEFIKGLDSSLAEGPVRSSQLMENASPEFKEKFRASLETKIKDLEGLDLVDGSYAFTNESVEDEKTQQIVKSALKEAMEEEFRFSEGSREEIDAKEKAVIKEFSKAFDRNEEEVAQMVKGTAEKAKEKETQKVVESLFKDKPGDKEEVVVRELQSESDREPLQEGARSAASEQPKKDSSLEETHLLKRLKESEHENKRLKDSLKAMEVKMASANSGNEALEKVAKLAKEEIQAEGIEPEESEFDKVVDDIEKAVEAVNKESLESLKQGKTIDKKEAEILANALAREEELLQSAREAQANNKRMEIEFKKKESLFSSEIQKADKALKAKELLVDKIKESMHQLVTKKQAEISEYKKQNEELNQRLKDNRATKLDAELKRARKDHESVAKIAEMYKNKVENMLKAKAQNAQSGQSEQLASENRTLSRMNIQLENKLNAELRDKKSIENQFNKIKAQEGKLRARASGAEDRYKRAIDEIEKLKANEARLVAIAQKKESKTADSGALKEIETLKATNAQLQDSLKNMTERLKSSAQPGAGSSDGPSTKEKRLEQNVKKLNTELAKARGEVGEAKKQIMKAKNESVALKNKIKQLEKAQGGKKKAA